MELKYAGMAVNERLYVSGLMERFDEAVAMKDAGAAFAILEEVALTEPSIRPILEMYGLQGDL